MPTYSRQSIQSWIVFGLSIFVFFFHIDETNYHLIPTSLLESLPEFSLTDESLSGPELSLTDKSFSGPVLSVHVLGP